MPTGRSISVFGPSEITLLSTAYDSALSCITEDGSGVGLTGRELRTQIAVGIIAAAKEGQLDPECLREAALHTLDKPFAEPE